MDGDLIRRASDLIAAVVAERDPRRGSPSDAPGAATRRLMVGIAGPPGAGKSTLAHALADSYALSAGARPDDNIIDAPAVVVPMDGFHLSNVELDRLGLADRKGAPETFDASGFIALLRRIRADEPLVYAPSYSRVLHESIGAVVPISAGTSVVIVEGNYLLLTTPPWDQVRPLLDLVIYLDAPPAVRIAGLVRRQMERGLTAVQASDWVYRSDEANARLIERTRDRADAILSRAE